MAAQSEVQVDHDRIRRFLDCCARTLTASAQAAASAPEALEGAARLRYALERSHPLAVVPRWLAALDSLAQVDDTDLGRDLAAIAPMLPWTPTMRADDDGHDFALCELHAVRELGDLVVGIMVVRPGAQYPLHHHPPQELYLTLSGQGRWRYGGHESFEPIGPLSTIYNHPDDLHSAIAGETPLIALYVLWR